MTDIIIIMPQDRSMATLLDRLGSEWQVDSAGKDAYCIKDESKHGFLSWDDFVEKTYEQAELSIIIARVPDPTFYALEFTDFSFGKKMILALIDDPAILIDDEFDHFMTGAELCQAIRNDPDYDWRTKRT